MLNRLSIVAATACLVGVLGFTLLEPSSTSALNAPRVNTAERFIQLLQIRERRGLTPGEERELRDLRLELIQTLRELSREPAETDWR